jgi:ribose 5-phosphate isomerase B
MNKGLKIAIGADHAGFEYKKDLIEGLDVKEVKDFGTYSDASADYPDFATP